MNDRRSAIVIALGLFAASETYAQNGGTSCATATTLVSGSSYTADTTAAPNWMTSFGPLVRDRFSDDLRRHFSRPRQNAMSDGDGKHRRR